MFWFVALLLVVFLHVVAPLVVVCRQDQRVARISGAGDEDPGFQQVRSAGTEEVSLVCVTPCLGGMLVPCMCVCVIRVRRSCPVVSRAVLQFPSPVPLVCEWLRHGVE